MKRHQLLVIGGGVAGYVAAIRGAQLGLEAACVESNPRLGGTCSLVGCIPSKALLESSHRFSAAKEKLSSFGVKVGDVELDLPAMLARKDSVVENNSKGLDFLFKKNKITRYQGQASFVSPHRVQVGEELIEAQHIVIATGSKPALLRNIEFDFDIIGTSTEALSYPAVPEHLVVIGAGAIGLELGSVWRRLGARVTVLEYLPHILPGFDNEIAAEALKTFRKQGLEFRLSTQVTLAKVIDGKAVITTSSGETIYSDRLLVATGRVPNTDGLNLQATGLKTDARGFIAVDEHHRTAVDGLFAIGDIVGGPMLAHKAEEEGIAVVEGITSGYGHVDYNTVPAVVYTDPEIASVGKSEEQLQSLGVAYKKGYFPFLANGRARALGAIEGKVKVLASTTSDRILGVHIIGPRAGDIIAEATLAMEFGASCEDIRRTSHAHPTLAECLKEAAMDAEFKALHI